MYKKVKIVIDGVETEVMLSEEDCAKLTGKKKTGYERAEKDETYYYEDSGEANNLWESGEDCDNELYNSANYYTDETLAQNNARADKLMRQLRRFAAENCKKVEWGSCLSQYYICYDYIHKFIVVNSLNYHRDFGQIYFDTRENAQKALDTFKDELIWYFTKYRDRV